MASQSGIPVKVHLETQIQQDGQLEKHVFDEDGQVVKMGESLYLRYLEHGGEQAPRYGLNWLLTVKFN